MHLVDASNPLAGLCATGRGRCSLAKCPIVIIADPGQEQERRCDSAVSVSTT